MTILTVVQDVCAVIGVIIPTSLFSGIGTNRTHQELLALANEMAQRMAYDNYDWTMLRAEQTYSGDDTTTAFNLPANYKRMLLTSHVWRSTSTQQPMRFIPNTDEWMTRRAASETDTWGEWTIYGGQMHIFPVMPVGTSARYVYQDKNCVVLTAGGFGDRFVADTDSYRLDERLLKLNMIWQWKAQKGSPYAEDMGTYTDALMLAVGKDSPRPIIIDCLPISAGARVAYPYPVAGPAWPFP